MPKAKSPKPAPGLYADTKVYDSGVTVYRIRDTRIEGGANNQVLFESSKAETRDRVLEAMQAREAARLLPTKAAFDIISA